MSDRSLEEKVQGLESFLSGIFVCFLILAFLSIICLCNINNAVIEAKDKVQDLRKDFNDYQNFANQKEAADTSRLWSNLINVADQSGLEWQYKSDLPEGFVKKGTAVKPKDMWSLDTPFRTLDSLKNTF